MTARFVDRRDAGQQLAKRLQRFAGRRDVVVVARSQDGAPVAFEIARAIKAPLQSFEEERQAADLHGMTLILVDDGLASEFEMAAAVATLRVKQPDRIVAAAPVGAADVCARVRCVADDCILALAPFPFRSVGDWYADFGQTTVDDVGELYWLAHADSRSVSAPAAEQAPVSAL